VKNKNIDPIHFIHEVFGFLNDSKLNFSDNFKKLTTWNSLNAVIIHHKIVQAYGVELNYEIFNTLETVEDLYQAVINKLNNAS
tara:strand:- start:164 stop:412 length:249 start_codon:yes stop_codon:yes gene_type:complete